MYNDKSCYREMIVASAGDKPGAGFVGVGGKQVSQALDYLQMAEIPPLTKLVTEVKIRGIKVNGVCCSSPQSLLHS